MVVVKLKFEMSDEAYASLQRVVGNFKRPYGDKKKMLMDEVFGELAEDLAMTDYRPGSWEGSNMQTVIDAHGWEL